MIVSYQDANSGHLVPSIRKKQLNKEAPFSKEAAFHENNFSAAAPRGSSACCLSGVSGPKELWHPPAFHQEVGGVLTQPATNLTRLQRSHVKVQLSVIAITYGGDNS